MRALLIGCGNIGAMYDYHSTSISSHAKAYQHFGVEVDFIEPNDGLASKVEKKYGFTRRDYLDIIFEDYTIISICTPTEFHAKYLLDTFNFNTPVVICEKPLAFDAEVLNNITEAYNKSTTKVIVNYIRRFQQGYGFLRQMIRKIKEPLHSIHCNYYKGILNYASHAIDTIYFLTGFNLSNDNIMELKRGYDYFKNDPTITFQGIQQNVDFSFRGLIIDFPIFEIDLVFNNYRACLLNGGDELKFYNRTEMIEHQNGLLKDYMLDVFSYAFDLLKSPVLEDNFEYSVNLNKTLVEIIKSNQT